MLGAFLALSLMTLILCPLMLWGIQYETRRAKRMSWHPYWGKPDFTAEIALTGFLIVLWVITGVMYVCS